MERPHLLSQQSGTKWTLRLCEDRNIYNLSIHTTQCHKAKQKEERKHLELKFSDVAHQLVAATRQQ